MPPPWRRPSSHWPECRPRSSGSPQRRSSWWSPRCPPGASDGGCRYETWHGLHLLLYLALGLAFVHQLQETTTFTASTPAKIYWWALWLFAFGALVTGRIVLPLWRNAYHRFRVAEVVLESDDVVSVRVTGRHLDGLPARAGQFCIWRFPGHHHWWLANPFSLSAAPDGRTLRLTAKAVGNASAACGTSRSAAARSSKGRTGHSPRCTEPGPACS